MSIATPCREPPPSRTPTPIGNRPLPDAEPVLAARARCDAQHRAGARRPGAGARGHARAGRRAQRRGPRARALADHEPARLGPRPHRRLRGPVAGPAPRGPGAAAAGSGRAVRRVRDAARGARGNRGARAGRGARLPGGRPRPHRRGARARAGSATGRSARWCSATSSSTPRRCARRWRSPGCCRPASRSSCEQPLSGSREARSDDWIELPAGPFAMGAAREGFAYDNERPRHTVELAAFQIARRPVSNAQLDALQRGRRLRAARVVVGRGLGVEAGVRHHPSSADRGGRMPRRPSATSPGSRPTPSPERTTRACPPRPSGRGRRA